MAVNAIDFSDLTKKPKPQGFQTPPPQPPQTQMGIKKSDGTVEPAMGYPVNQMGQGDELLQLFPIPVMICPYPTDYTKELVHSISGFVFYFKEQFWRNLPSIFP